jgi:hypothetical protein
MEPDEEVEREEERAAEVAPFPALASGKMSMNELWARLTIISSYFTSDQTSYWDRINSILVLVSELFQEDIVQTTLPADASSINKWDPWPANGNYL